MRTHSTISLLVFASAAFSVYADNTYPFPSSGSVGIGTTNPAGKLDIRQTRSDAAATSEHVFFGDSTGAFAGLRLPTTGGIAIDTINGTWGERFRITAAGNVGIGTANPTAKLDIDFADATWAIKGQRAGTNLFAIHANSSNPVVFETIGSRDLKFQTAQGNGTVFYMNSAGNVGIGTDTPTGKLDVVSTGHTRLLVHANNALNDRFPTLELKAGNTEAGAFSIIKFSKTAGSVAEGLQIRNGSDVAAMAILGSGNVGIGTTSPSASLDIWKSYSAGTDSLRFSFNDGSAYWMGIQPYVVGAGNVGYKFRTNNSSTTVDAMAITGTGNVGIGTNNPTHKLSVNGTIRTKEVIVESTGWADYVFKPDYRLAPLSEVESAIQRNGHLPGIPSAKDISEQGLSLGEMQTRMMAKIEELTLYVIDLKKENAAQAKRIEQLEAAQKH